RQVPGAPAVILGDATLLYGELDECAERIAAHLRHLGVGADVVVGILMERSMDRIVAVLAVLKAGGACLPIDPSQPAERQAFMLEESRAPVLITQPDLAPALPAGGARVLCLTDLAERPDPAVPP